MRYELRTSGHRTSGDRVLYDVFRDGLVVLPSVSYMEGRDWILSVITTGDRYAEVCRDVVTWEEIHK